MRRSGLLLVAGLHLALAWALWRLAAPTPLPTPVRPLWVSLAAPDTAADRAPELAPPSRPKPSRDAAAQAVQPARKSAPLPPLVQAPAPLTVPPPVGAAMPAPDADGQRPALAGTSPQAAPTTNTAASDKSLVAPPKLLRAEQMRYLEPPPAEMPLMSKRAGESGVVWLRVRIDAQGRPVRIGLHRSSGFKRLDEQALAAMSQARFAPRVEDGLAIEVEVIAPIEYVAE